jgi:TP901 family phage tail tape measure protein
MSKVAATIQMMLDAKGMSTGLQQIDRQFGGLAKSAMKFGAQLGLAFSAVAITKDAINIINNYAEANSRLRAILQGTEQEMARLKKTQQELGAQTKFTASEVANAQTELAKLGFTSSEIANATAGVLNLAAAGGIELARAAEIVGGSLRGMGLDATETNRVVDVMAKGFTTTALDAEKYAEAMKMVAPIAKAAGIDIETTTALVGKLSDSMISGSLGGTALKNLLSQLADENSGLSKEIGFSVKNSDDLIRAFEVLSKKNIDLSKATQLTDERSKAAFLTLVQGTESLKDLRDELLNSEGAAQQLADTMTDNLRGDIDRAKSSWEAFVLSLEDGEGMFSKVTRGAVKLGSTLVDVMTDLNNNGWGIGLGGLFSNQVNKLIDETIDNARSIQMDKLLSQVKDAVEFNKELGKEGKKLSEIEAEQIGLIKEKIDLHKDRLGPDSDSVKAWESQIEAIQKYFSSLNKGVDDSTKKVVELTKEQQKAAAEALKMRIELENAVNAAMKGITMPVSDASAGEKGGALAEMFSAGVISAEQLTFEITKATQGLNAMLEVGDEIGRAFADMVDPIEWEPFSQNLEKINEQLQIKSHLLERNQLIISGFGGTLTRMLEQGMEDFENFGEVIVRTLKRMAAELAATAAIALLLNSLLPGGGGGFAKVFGMLGGGGGIGAFLGFGGAGGAGVGGGGGGDFFSRISGNDIVLSGDRTNQSLGRIGR